MALSEKFSGILHGNANDDDFGFEDIQPGFIDGHGLIFLSKNKYVKNNKYIHITVQNEQNPYRGKKLKINC